MTKRIRNPIIAGKSLQERREYIGQRQIDAPCCCNCKWWDRENDREYGQCYCLCPHTQFYIGRKWIISNGYDICNFFERIENK